MAILAKAALKSKFFREVIKTVQYTLPETNLQKERTIVQHNQLVRRGKYFYPKAIGGKTGRTLKAGYSLVAAAEHEGRTLIAVLLNAPTIPQRYRDATALFDAAFSQKKMQRTLFNKDYDFFTLLIKGGKTVLQAGLKENFAYDYFPAEEPEYKAVLHWHSIRVPVLKDQLVGEIRLVTPQGQLVAAASLYATQDVQATLTIKFGRIVKAAGGLKNFKIGLLFAAVFGCGFAI